MRGGNFWAVLLDQPEQDYDFLIHKLNLTRSVIKALEEQKVLILESEQVYRNPVICQQKEQKEIIYTEEQRTAIQTFQGIMNRDFVRPICYMV